MRRWKSRKKTIVKNHVHLPAMPTAASGVSPKRPIIMVSTSVKGGGEQVLQGHRHGDGKQRAGETGRRFVMAYAPAST